MKKIATTGLLLLSSAALGGVAVALWNQRTLAKLRGLEEERGGDCAGDEQVVCRECRTFPDPTLQEEE